MTNKTGYESYPWDGSRPEDQDDLATADRDPVNEHDERIKLDAYRNGVAAGRITGNREGYSEAIHDAVRWLADAGDPTAAGLLRNAESNG